MGGQQRTKPPQNAGLWKIFELLGIDSIAYFLLSVKTEGGIFISLVENIKALCVSRSMTLAELERTLGLGNGTISKWDKVEPGFLKVRKVADYFGVTLDELLKEQDGR